MVAEVSVEVEVDVVGVAVGLDLFDELQAATQSAVAPAAARTANRARRGACGLTDINDSPIVVLANIRGLPVEAENYLCTTVSEGGAGGEGFADVTRRCSGRREASVRIVRTVSSSVSEPERYPTETSAVRTAGTQHASAALARV